MGNSQSNGESGSRRSSTPGSDPSRRNLEPVCIGVHSGEAVEDDGNDDDDVNHHGRKGGTDEDTQVDTDRANVELHEIGKNQEEDTNGSHGDEESDDLGDHALNLLNDTDDGRTRALDEITDDDGGDDDGKKLIVGQSINDVGWDEGSEHIQDDGVNCTTFLGVLHGIVIFVDSQGFFADRLELLGPDKTRHETGQGDGNDGGDDVVSDSPPGKDRASLGHFSKPRYGQQHGTDDEGKDWSRVNRGSCCNQELPYRQMGQRTDCLESSQPEITRNGNNNRDSRWDGFSLSSDDDTDGNGQDGGADDLKSRARLLDRVPPWPLDGLLDRMGLLAGVSSDRLRGRVHSLLGILLLGGHCDKLDGVKETNSNES